MFHAAIAAVIEAARTFAQMDEAGRQLWQGHASGALSDEEAQALAERLHERRHANREPVRPVGVVAGRISIFPPRRSPRSPDRIASRDRRRLLACSGPMPPALAARFTEGQRAVLKIVADEIAANRECGLCIDAIAGRAGVCRRLAQGAIRLAEGDGLLTIEERRHQGRKNSPNLVRIISREWQAWIARSGKQKRQDATVATLETGEHARSGERAAEAPVKPIGCKAMRPTGSLLILRTVSPAKTGKRLPKQQSFAHR
ncbi:hypothetical protein [Methylobacterium flocculans]|uniref:hypothetical protein n=1 Tax=Methylobacterium flocculans TaxID=2984843 RepID=UPI0021F353A9|nr:hypothetical protein [Methylobacterium sp. FF17]